MRLSKAQAPSLQSLLQRCGAFYEMVEGRPAGPDAAMEELESGPPECPPNDRFCLGLRSDTGEIAGIINVFRHFRQRNEWYLAFFMLDPDWRGIGRSCYLAFENWVAVQHGEKILLAVVEPNHMAARFWESLGFAFPRCYPPTNIGLRKHVLIEYEKSLKHETITKS